jgi:non-ribosomal peptide synthase protein (TIGR01720 family)
VPLDPADTPGPIREHIRRFVHARPRGGLGYALLRAGASPGDAIASVPASSIRFNYLGSMRPAASVAAAFTLLGATTRRSPRASSSYAIEIDAQGSADGTSIDITWTYDARAFRAETIARLADRFEDALATLVGHGAADEHDGARRLASLPFAQVTERQLTRLLREHPALEDLYPLTPVQQGILFHCLYEPGSGVYIDQFSCDLLGPLDGAAFTAAWRAVIQKHPVLRTSITWEGLDRPHQAVHARVEPEITYEDGRELAPGAGVAAWLEADRSRGFELSRAPLLRVALFRTAPDRHTLACSWHHLILDGWSLRILLQDVARIYRALTTGASHIIDTFDRSPAPRFSEYVEWLSHRDEAAATDFWRTYLQGASLTSIRGPSAAGRPRIGDETDEASWPVGVELSARLASFARARCLTMSTVFEAAWALVVSQRAGAPDVVFGLTVSSRPASLPHADTAVGLYINTVPLRIRLTPSTLVTDWLDDLQKNVASLQLYAHSPLPVIQAGARLSGPVFDHLLAIENYPVHESGGAMGLTIGDIRSVERTNYSLTVAVVPGRDITLQAISQRRHLHSDDARAFLGELARAVDAIVCSPESTVDEIRVKLTRDRRAAVHAPGESALTASEADAASRALAGWRSSGLGTTTP